MVASHCDAVQLFEGDTRRRGSKSDSAEDSFDTVSEVAIYCSRLKLRKLLGRQSSSRPAVLAARYPWQIYFLEMAVVL
jgi:hypothetical protein